MPETVERVLPVFQLAPAGVDRGLFETLLKEFGLEGQPEAPLPEGGRRVADGARYLEASDDGLYWYADDDRLWNPASVPANLPDREAAKGLALDLLKRLNLLPVSQPDWRVVSEVAVSLRTRSAAATLNDTGAPTRGPREELDAYVGFRTRIAVDDPSTGRPTLAEAQGLGTKIGVVFGEGGAVIGLNASWRTITKRKLFKALAPIAPAVREPVHGSSLRSAVVIPNSHRLIYRRTMLQGQPHLCPYWLFEVSFINGDRSFRSADLTTPAAAFQGDLAGVAQAYRSRTVASAPNAGTGARAIGVSWMTDGDHHANDEVALVLDQVAKAGWDVRFAWRDEDAWESDWSSDSARWVDSADLAYYTGHAAYFGWQLIKNAGQEFLMSRTIGTDDATNALWSQDLRWAIIAACGPLQDDYVYSPNDNAFEWAGAFDGFRLLMGFASAIAGFTAEGGRTLELARRGVPFARAWLRAAREAQPCQGNNGIGLGIDRWAAVLAGENGQTSALDDLMPEGAGQPAGPLKSTRLRAIWTPA